MNPNLSNIPPALQSMMSSSKAEILRLKDINKHITLSLWANETDYIDIKNVEHHTLSLYFKGGDNVHRLDKTEKNLSGENTLCLMPKDENYIWSIDKPFQLAHLYFTDDYLKQIAIETFDRDPRDVHLNEMIFEDDQVLASLMRYGIFENDWKNNQNHHFIDHAIQMILLRLLQNNIDNNFKLPKVKGGLSNQNKIMVKEYIHDNIEQSLSLMDLSSLLNLSEFHFARMFKQSFAVAPHQYIQKTRIDKAVDQISNNVPLIDIAYNCGFSSQSHLGRIFKQYKGVTPHQFKTAHH